MVHLAPHHSTRLGTQLRVHKSRADFNDTAQQNSEEPLVQFLGTVAGGSISFTIQQADPAGGCVGGESQPSVLCMGVSRSIQDVAIMSRSQGPDFSRGSVFSPSLGRILWLCLPERGNSWSPCLQGLTLPSQACADTGRGQG